MNTILCESLYEINNIIAECNSQFIYESIMMESDIIDVDYKEVDKDDKKESIEKKKSMIEKIKSAWKTFIAAMKKIIRSCIGFLRKNKNNINKDSQKTIRDDVTIEDRTDFLNALKRVNMDTKNGTVFKNIASAGKFDDYYFKNALDSNQTITMNRVDAIKLLEKQLNKANELIEEFDKEVDKKIKDYEDSMYTLNPVESINLGSIITAIKLARTRYKDQISDIVYDIQKLVAGANKGE